MAGMVAVAHTLPYDIAVAGDDSIAVERLAAIGVPTLVIDGGESPAWSRNAAAAVAGAIQGAVRRTIDGQDHGVAHGPFARG